MPKSFDIQGHSRPIGTTTLAVPNPVRHVANTTMARLTHVRVTQPSLMKPGLSPVGMDKHVPCHRRQGLVLAAQDIPYGLDPEDRVHPVKERILTGNLLPKVVSGGPIQQGTNLEGGCDSRSYTCPLVSLRWFGPGAVHPTRLRVAIRAPAGPLICPHGLSASPPSVTTFQKALTRLSVFLPV